MITFSDIPFGLLLISVALYTVVGWVVLFGFVPLYVLPLLAGVAILISFPRFFTFRRADAFFGLLLAFVVWTFVSTFAARDVTAAIRMNLNWLAGIGLAFYTMHAVRSVEQASVLVRWYLLLHSAALFLALEQVAFDTGWWSPGVYTGGQPSGFENMNFAFGKNYLPLLGLGLAGVFWFDREPGFPSRRLAWLCAIVGVVGVALSGGRSTQLATLCGFVLIVLVGRASGLRPLLLTFAALATVLIVLAGSDKWGTAAIWPSQTVDGVLPLRTTLLQTALAVFRDHWLMGVGGGNFQWMFFDYFDGDVARLTGDFNVDTHEAVPTHNILMNILVGHGLVAACCFVAACCLASAYAWRCFNATGPPLDVRWLGLGVLLFLLMYGVDIQFHNYDSDNNVWLFVGMLLGLRSLSLGDTTDGRARPRLS